jgi:hypothetical protein
MGIAFPGGVDLAEIADADDFDTSANANFLVEIDRNSIAKEGTEIPEPEPVTAELADDRQIRMGVDQDINMRLADLPMTDFDTLEGACNDGTEVYIRLTSTQKTDSGDPVWKVVYNRIILNNVAHGPAKFDRSAYGVVLVDGMTTGGSSKDIYTLTQNGTATS